MAADGSVIVEIDGDDSKFKKALSDLKSITGTALRGIATATAAASAALVGLSGAAVAVGKDFETSLAGTSTMFGEVAVNMQGLTDQIGDVTKQGTGQGSVTVTGSPTNSFSLLIEITVAGARNAAAFRYSMDQECCKAGHHKGEPHLHA